MPMDSLPTLLSGSVARYPVTSSTVAPTGIIQFVNGSEQRWRRKARLQVLELTYQDVNSYDLGVMIDFFNTKKGKFVDAALTNVFSVTLGADTFDYCCFDQDEIQETMTKANRYSFTLKIKQVRHS